MHKLVIFALLTLSPPTLFGVALVCRVLMKRRTGRRTEQEYRNL